MVVRLIHKFKILNKVSLFLFSFSLISCSTIDSTIDSTWDSITSAGDYLYDSIAIWENNEEPEQSEAIVIEEAVEVPDFALPEQGVPLLDQNYSQMPPQQNPQNFSNSYYDPIYRSQRQYYFVGPNGTPMLAPPPPPFPQYSIDQARETVPYSYYNNLNVSPQRNFAPRNDSSLSNLGTNENFEAPQQVQPQVQPIQRNLSKEEEMEIFGIQNNCIRVTEDYINGGYMCDDFD
ncbi:MAG: hypothetical protein CMM99_03075 [Rickettsiales bacterium]|nr:hypothetical protein [Rickettsiales bacterium]